MDSRLSYQVAGHDSGESTALYHWLRADAALARQGTVTAGRPGTGELGALDVIDVVLTQVTGITTLALAVAGWRRSRARPGPTTVTRPDGRSITVDGPPEVVAETIERFLQGDEPAG